MNKSFTRIDWIDGRIWTRIIASFIFSVVYIMHTLDLGKKNCKHKYKSITTPSVLSIRYFHRIKITGKISTLSCMYCASDASKRFLVQYDIQSVISIYFGIIEIRVKNRNLTFFFVHSHLNYYLRFSFGRCFPLSWWWWCFAFCGRWSSSFFGHFLYSCKM